MAFIFPKVYNTSLLNFIFLGSRNLHVCEILASSIIRLLHSSQATKDFSFYYKVSLMACRLI